MVARACSGAFTSVTRIGGGHWKFGSELDAKQRQAALSCFAGEGAVGWSAYTLKAKSVLESKVITKLLFTLCSLLVVIINGCNWHAARRPKRGDEGLTFYTCPGF